MRRAQGADVVSLAVIVPSDELDHGEAFLEHLVPTIINQGAAWEDPVLAE